MVKNAWIRKPENFQGEEVIYKTLKLCSSFYDCTICRTCSGQKLKRRQNSKYTDPQIPVSVYDELVSVDIVRSEDDIWIVEHQSGI